MRRVDSLSPDPCVASELSFRGFEGTQGIMVLRHLDCGASTSLYRTNDARWATPETRSTSNEPETSEIIASSGSAAASQESWRDCSAGANRRDPSLPWRFAESATTDGTPSGSMGPTRAQWSSPGPGELAVTDPSPRAAVVASLASTLSRAVALGDEVAARVVHEAIGRLLGLAVAPEG